MEQIDLTRQVLSEVLDQMPKEILESGLYSVGTNGNDPYFWEATIWVDGLEAGFIFPKKYCNLWPQRCKRAVKETLINIGITPL